jgi:RND family efflux transporter MFP subunit
MNERSKKALRVCLFVGGAIGLILLMLYMTGFFSSNKISPGKIIGTQKVPFQPTRTAKASIETIKEFYEAVGTVRPETEISIEAQLTGKILEVLVRPGDKVTKDKLLVLLDSRELQARLDQARQGLLSARARAEQARQAVMAAEAAYAQAESAFKRTKVYYKSEAATSQDLEQAKSTYLQAKARVQQTQDALIETKSGINQAAKVIEEAKIAMGYTKIVATQDGEVAKRLAEPGDLAWPGKTLLVIQTRGALRLEALVREGLIYRISPGKSLKIVVDALDKVFDGTVEEVVPSADPMTRTFLVKVALPREQGLFPGMFGRLLVPVQDRNVVVVPKEAVRHIGQLDVVMIKTDGIWQSTYVKTGEELEGGTVEILSGLKGDEMLGLGDMRDG